MSLQGLIEEMDLGVVIQALSLNRYRGTLRIETEEAGSQFFFISEGEIVLVRQVKRDPVRLGDLLIRAGKISEGDLQEALAQQKQRKKRLGEVIVDMGLVTQDEIEGVIRTKFEEEFLDMFLLDKGRFEFIFGLTPEALFAPDEKLERVALSASGMMMDAMRRLDEWQEMIKSLGSFDTIYRSRIGAEGLSERLEGVTLPNQTCLALAGQLDGTRSLRDVIGVALRENLATRMETFQLLHALRQAELIHPMDFKTLLGNAKEALGSGDVPAAGKSIRGILSRKDRVDVGLVKRYLEFLRKHKRPRLAFDEARRFAGQCLASDDTEGAISLYEVALEVGRNVELLDRLFYSLLRANRRQRAIDVGLMLREFLVTDRDLAVAARVCKNLQELDEQNPEVIEFAGLLLKRQERYEEATEQLELALRRMTEEHPRRKAVIDALLELHPERDDLRAQNESLALLETQRRLRREIRRRWIFVAGALVLALFAWRGWVEFRARGALETAEAYVQAQGELKSGEQFREASGLFQQVLSYGSTTVEDQAQTQKQAVDKAWDELIRRQRAEIDAEVARQRERQEAERAKAAAEEAQRAMDAAFQEYEQLLRSEDHEAISARALELREAYGETEDPRLAGLRVFVRVESKPAGAEVFAGRERVGQTPVHVAVPLGGNSTVRLRLPRHRVVEIELPGERYDAQTVTLAAGPTWEYELGEPPRFVRSLGERVVVAGSSGQVVVLDARHGKERWSRELQAELQGARESQLSSLAVVGERLVVAQGSVLAGISLDSGEVEWQERVEMTVPIHVIGARVKHKKAVRAVVAALGGSTLRVLDAASGDGLQAVKLPAAVTQPPAAKDATLFVALEGVVAAVTLGVAGDPKLLWQAQETHATGPLIYTKSALAVLVPGKDRYLCVGESDGEVVAILAPGIGPLRASVLDEERLYLLAENGLLCVLRSYDGRELVPARPAAKVVRAGPVRFGAGVLVAADSGELIQVSRSGRRQAKPLELKPPADEPLVVHGDSSVLVVQGNKLSLLELAAE